MIDFTIIIFLFPIKEKENDPVIYYLFQNFSILLAMITTIISGLIYAIKINNYTKKKNGKN